tara:strand:+ start:226 stop:801 length:576 start_codon:yes stop_codon:yes gene_type:complete
MRISRLGTLPALGDAVDTNGNAIVLGDKIFSIFEADGAIAIGAPVQLQVDVNTTAGNVNGIEVVEADTSNAGGGTSGIVGAFQGENLSNPGYDTVVTTNSDGSDADGGSVVLRGKAAVDGNLIMVQCYGAGYVLAEGTTDVLAGDSMITDATGGRMITVADLADGSVPAILALSPVTEAAEGAIACFIRAM